jgi:hypothetical protein
MPLSVGPVYACFEINDELLVIDTAIDQAKSDDKKWAEGAEPRFAFYRSGIENGLTNLNPPLAMNGKWNVLLAPDIVSYSGTTDNDFVKEIEKGSKAQFPRVSLSITETSIDFADWKIQTSTGRFTYWIDPLNLGKNIQLSGQCAIFKREFKIEALPKTNIQHTSWKQIN